MIARRGLLIGLYCASGAAALVYEVVWTRLLTLQLGHTVAAASTVLAAFMGGLALGAWAAGRALPAPGQVGRLGQFGRNPLRLYAALEIAIAVCALALPFVLRGAVPLLAWAYADGTAPVRFALLRVAISLTLVGIPAAAMGATFPIAAEWLAARPGRSSALSAVTRGPKADGSSGSAAVLYAANTLGAAAGAVAAGFWLVPAIGLRATTWVGVVLNVVAAAGALWISMPHAELEEPAEEKIGQVTKTAKTTKRPQKAPHVPRVLRETLSPSPRLAWTAVAISGFSALVYEVAWTRLLALVIGPTTYAFATMAAAFIAGLAVGSAVGTPLSRRVARPRVWLASMLIAGALASIIAAWYAATRLPFVVATEVGDPEAALSRVVGAQAVVVGLLLLPSTLALGAAFPLALVVGARADQTVARGAAGVYTANTLGAILGALAAGFLLIPLLGLRTTFQVAAVVSVVGGAVVFGRTAALAVAAAAIAGIVAVPAWDRELLASGAYKYAPYLQSADLETVLRAGTLEFYKEGAAGTVSVKRLTGVRSLAIDGKVDASNGGDMLTQRLLGLLPILLHGNARSIAVIGLGSGVTVGSALVPGTVQRADVIEISPEVVEASHLFDAESGRVLSQPGVRLIVGDGRSHLLLTPRRYDVIVSEPSNPWMAGVAALFTREFFEAARDRLEPGGLLCQWAHTYDISADDLKSIVRTFTEVFPQGTMWLVGEGDLLLVGEKESAKDGGIDRRVAALAAECRKGATPATLSTVGIDPDSAPFSLLSLYTGGPRDLVRYGGDARIQTDDGMALEYSAPRGIYGRSTSDNAADLRKLGADLPAAVREALDRATDTDWTSRGTMLLKADAFGLAYEAFKRAATLNSRNAAALAGLSETAGGAHRESDAHAWLASAAAREPGNAAVAVELAHVLASTGQYEQALQVASRAVETAPADPHAAEQLASILSDAGDADRLTPLADRLIERFPGRQDPVYYRASALFLRGRSEEAIAAVQPLVAAQPDHARAQNLLGAACATLGRRDCARAAFEASLRANPKDSSTYVNAGTFALQNADPNGAVSYFAEALSIDPTADAARNGLAQARAQLATKANPR